MARKGTIGRQLHKQKLEKYYNNENENYFIRIFKKLVVPAEIPPYKTFVSWPNFGLRLLARKQADKIRQHDEPVTLQLKQSGFFVTLCFTSFIIVI